MIGVMVGDIVGSISEAICGTPKVISDCAIGFLSPLIDSNVAEFYKTLVQRKNGKD